MRYPLYSILLITSMLVCSVSRADVSISTLDERLVRSSDIFENVLGSKSGPIPRTTLAAAQGILIFREYGAGFVFGGKGGFGVAMARQKDGRWGAPAFLGAGEGNFGLQIGVQRQDLVFLFMSIDALKVFNQDHFKIGADISAAAGPVGASAQAKLSAPVFVYSDNSGLYAGATFEGGLLLADKDANEKYYNKMGIRVGEILRGENVKFPVGAEALRRDLDLYETGKSRN